ncbi:chemotaxis protein CheB [Hydrogenophaga sp.]|uniref:chemotaxis protein CheB n=1 Tax=Hydrogenophaga sp. TaxID=1904254 RepID=UPI00272FE226|nr:chemotaxis protein CheB [Hydrogenophaga sp.]MDP1683626.1 chemotaxis protein CheB [Hydrogenophaga sp.]
MVTKKQQGSPRGSVGGGEGGGALSVLPAASGTATCPVVALGASAGGLEAFEQFLRAMPVDTGMGFVLVQHLDPTHPSILTEILRRSTAMTVVEATDGMAVEPNRVHVIPPNRDMVITHGVLGLSLPSEPRGRHLPIDSFFRSLAADQGDAAVGIILSGTGTDGTLGVRAIHGAGGLGLVQEPSTARFDGMPASALKSGFATQALAVEAMPALLQAHVRRLGSRLTVAEGGESSRRLAGVLMQLRLGTGHDFSQYKKSTLGRRIERRMTQQGIEDIATYERFLKEHPPEVQTLFREMLINVTSFFRDTAVFETLKRDVLPAMLAHRPEHESFRVWVAGCATGEEAYSVAMLLRELADEQHKDWQVLIYGTDIDADAIAVARAGLYPPNIAQDVSPERLRRFFVKEEAGYRVRKEIREMVVFAVQSVIKDPPFTRLDLLTCRNVLIYLEPELQERLVPIFHYALRPAGVLCLSPSESIGSHGELFETLDRRLNIYRARPTVASRRAVISSRLSWATEASGTVLVPVVTKPREAAAADLAKRTLLQAFAPASVLTDLHGDILFVHGETGRFLRLAPGQPTHNVVDMATESLQIEVREALKRAAGGDLASFSREVAHRINDELQTVSLSVRAIAGPEPSRHLLLFSFQEQQGAPQRGPARRRKAGASTEAQRVQALEHELLLSKQTLGAMVEEQQISNEELQSTNEELQSTNEELQSTNEELETSKEELQSVNEELVTVNSELQIKVEQLTGMQDDMKNLLDNISVGSIFLDRHLVIRRFTRDASAVYRLMPSDTGRPLADIRCDLQDVDLLADAQTVLDTLTPVEREVRTATSTWYQVRIKPYRTVDNVIDGVVLTFNDVTERVLALAMRHARDLAEAVVDTVYEPLVVLDDQLQVLTANRAFLALFGGQAADTLGHRFFEIADRQWDFAAMHELLDGSQPDQRAGEDRVFSHAFAGIGVQHLRVRTRRVSNKSLNTGLVLVSFAPVQAAQP